MNAHPGPHPTEELLGAYVLGKLAAPEAETVRDHLKGCPACQQRAAKRSPGHRDGFVGESRPSATQVVPPAMLAEHPDHRIVRMLDRGSYGISYLAENRRMGRNEVLKIITARPGGPDPRIDRILAEVGKAAQLRHPNIATLYSARCAGNDLVLAMEYVEGLDLRRVVRSKGTLPLANACHYVNQIASGLQSAHENGLVHRDVEPGKLVLANQGGKAIVKILDFGLSGAGSTLSTPEFAAPEQISNPAKVDIRADIYSLGCVLYFLLTGDPPFQGANLYEILQAHQSMDALPLNVARPDVPMPLAIIAATMLAKEPARRFPTPRDVSQALSPFLRKEKPAAVVAATSVAPPAVASPFELSVGLDQPAPVPAPKRPSFDLSMGLETGPAPPAARAPQAPAPSKVSTPPVEPGWALPIEIQRDEDLTEELQSLREARAMPAWLWPATASVLVFAVFGLMFGPRLVSSADPPEEVAQADRHPEPPSRYKFPPWKTNPPVAPSPETAPEPTPFESAHFEPPTPPAADQVSDQESKATGSLDHSSSPRPQPAPTPVPAPEPKPAVSAPAPATKPVPKEVAVADKAPLAAAPPANPGAPMTPEQILAKHGLQKEKTYYVTPTEADYRAAWNGLVPFDRFMQEALIEANVAYDLENKALWLNDQIIGLQADIQEASQLMGNANRQQRAVLQMRIQQDDLALTEARGAFAQVNSRRVGPVKLQQLKDEFLKRRTEFLEKSATLRPIMDKIDAEYTELKRDPEVASALRALKERTKVQYDLGPSKDHRILRRKQMDSEENISFDPEAYRRRKKSTKLRQSPKAGALGK